MFSKTPLLTKKDFPKHVVLVPSDRIFYDEYPYRLDFHHPQYPHPDHNPDINFEITQFMKSCNMSWKRERTSYSSGKRSIYLHKHQDVLWLANWMASWITEIHGPVSKQHLAYLGDFDYVIRDKKWHGKYDFRVEFFLGSAFTGGYGNTGYGRTNTDRRAQATALSLFMAENYDDYRWSNKSLTWYYNYFYCNKEEYKEMEPFLLLGFKKEIGSRQNVIIRSQL